MKILYQTDLKAEKSINGSAVELDSSCDTENTAPTLSIRAPDVSKSCLKQLDSVEKAVKRPILYLVKEERFNHIQRHLHPLAYICD